MDELVEEEIELEENVEEQEVVSKEDLVVSGLEDSSFLYSTYEAFEDAQLLFEDDNCQENVVQTHSKLKKRTSEGTKETK